MARMNQKASVSKELNAKHTKILEGLLKQPENRECADCRGRAPRWASVNLGIFICMQCSGIHRSLGVHISKVRSTTLDTWLPDQIAFMQSMGNEKSNGYWEADLPTNFDRSGTEKFIRAKYEEKRWAPKGMAPPSETTINSNRLVEVEGNKIPKKTRKLSLDEEHLAEKAPVNPISLRPRAGSLDFNIKTSTSAALMSGNDVSTKKAEGVQDFLNLPYPRDAEHNLSTASPATWATFE